MQVQQPGQWPWASKYDTLPSGIITWSASSNVVVWRAKTCWLFFLFFVFFHLHDVSDVTDLVWRCDFNPRHFLFFNFNSFLTQPSSNFFPMLITVRKLNICYHIGNVHQQALFWQANRTLHMCYCYYDYGALLFKTDARGSLKLRVTEQKCCIWRQSENMLKNNNNTLFVSHFLETDGKTWRIIFEGNRYN